MNPTPRSNVTTMNPTQRKQTAQHTPGPWKTAGFTIYAQPEKRSFGGPIREYLCPVCSMEPGETDGPEYLDRSSGAEYNERLPGDAEAHANARLIALAPTMAQTIQDVLDWTEGDIEAHLELDADADLGHLNHRATQLRAILARINGEGGGV